MQKPRCLLQISSQSSAPVIRELQDLAVVPFIRELQGSRATPSSANVKSIICTLHPCASSQWPRLHTRTPRFKSRANHKPQINGPRNASSRLITAQKCSKKGLVKMHTRCVLNRAHSTKSALSSFQDPCMMCPELHGKACIKSIVQPVLNIRSWTWKTVLKKFWI